MGGWATPKQQAPDSTSPLAKWQQPRTDPDEQVPINSPCQVTHKHPGAHATVAHHLRATLVCCVSRRLMPSCDGNPNSIAGALHPLHPLHSTRTVSLSQQLSPAQVYVRHGVSSCLDDFADELQRWNQGDGSGGRQTDWKRASSPVRYVRTSTDLVCNLEMPHRPSPSGLVGRQAGWQSGQ